MKHLVDERLVLELLESGLVYCCERCGHFDEGEQSCSLGFPTEPHRDRPLVLGTELSFCKTFELCG